MVRATSAKRTDAPGVLTASRITRWEVGARNRSGRVPASHRVGLLQRRPPAEPAAVPRPTVVLSVSRPPRGVTTGLDDGRFARGVAEHVGPPRDAASAGRQ